MKNRDLIEQLQRFDLDHDVKVIIGNSCNAEISNIHAAADFAIAIRIDATQLDGLRQKFDNFADAFTDIFTTGYGG